jgi:hypothetical protein
MPSPPEPKGADPRCCHQVYNNHIRQPAGATPQADFGGVIMTAVARSLKNLAQKTLGAGHLEVTRAGNVPRLDLLFRNLKR